MSESSDVDLTSIKEIRTLSFKSSVNDICSILLFFNIIKLLAYLLNLSILVIIVIRKNKDLLPASNIGFNIAMLVELTLFLTQAIWIYYIHNDFKQLHFEANFSRKSALIASLVPLINIIIFYRTCFDISALQAKFSNTLPLISKKTRFWTYVAISGILIFILRSILKGVIPSQAIAEFLETIAQDIGKIVTSFSIVMVMGCIKAGFSLMEETCGKVFEEGNTKQNEINS